MSEPDAPQEIYEKTAFDEYADFIIKTDLEKVRIFRDLMKAGTMVTVYFAGGADFILSTVLHADNERGLIVFEFGPDKERNAKLLASGRITGVTMHNHVKVQFICDELQPCQYKGEAAVCCALPKRMLRLQRRDTFRQSVPVGMKITCQLQTDDHQQLELGLVDISAGGVCLADETARLDLPPTTPIPYCRISLGEHGTVEAKLEVRNRYMVTLKTGREVQRIGCQFRGLPAQMNAIVQRFIVSIDRERRRLGTGGQ